MAFGAVRGNAHAFSWRAHPSHGATNQQAWALADWPAPRVKSRRSHPDGGRRWSLAPRHDLASSNQAVSEGRHAPSMAVRDRRVDAGRRRGEALNRMIGSEVRIARRMAGVSQDQLGSVVDLSGSEVGRVEHGKAPWLTVIHASELLSAVGLDLWAKAYTAGPPVRYAAHLRLLADFEGRLHATIRCEREWLIPGESASASNRRDAVEPARANRRRGRNGPGRPVGSPT